MDKLKSLREFYKERSGKTKAALAALALAPTLALGGCGSSSETAASNAPGPVGKQPIEDGLNCFAGFITNPLLDSGKYEVGITGEDVRGVVSRKINAKSLSVQVLSPNIEEPVTYPVKDGTAVVELDESVNRVVVFGNYQVRDGSKNITVPQACTESGVGDYARDSYPNVEKPTFGNSGL